MELTPQPRGWPLHP